MKPSYYNFFIPYEQDEEKYIAYNARSNSLALMDGDKYEIFMDFCNHNTPINDEDFISSLKAGMFILEDNVNELDILRYTMLRSRFNSTSFGLTIAPTSDCNFRCIYCYEKDVIKQNYMTREVQDKIIELLQSKAKTITNFSVTWYGGEPLLAIDTIEYLTKEFKTICNENEIAYSAGMVTNGYLLTRDIAEKLEDLNINFIQITIDGMPETHNIRRPLIGGKPTFDTIIKNLKDSVDILPRTALRINVDKENISSGLKVADYIKEQGLEEKVFPYIGRVTGDNGCYATAKCFDMKEYAKEEYAYTESLSQADKNVIKRKYPSLRNNFCGADYNNSFVISAEGDLYKCWNDIGNKEYCVGNIDTNIGSLPAVFLDYMLLDPTNDSKCSQCKVLPICMGGCPQQRVTKNQDKCSTYKYVLDSYVKSIANIIKQEQQQQLSTQ